MESKAIHEKIYEYLMAVEKLGQEIITDKRLLVTYDSQRNLNREAIRDLKKSGQRKCYITIGSALVKNNVQQALDILEERQKQISISINKIQSNLKVKVNDLRDLEMQVPFPGSSLKPLSEKETTLLTQMKF